MDNRQLSTLNYDNIKEIERHITTYKTFLQIPQATANDISFFAQYCQRTKLDPLSRQIYAIPKREGSMQILLSIDGYRIIAQRTGEYEGSETFWCGTDGVWTDVWLNNNPPSAAKVIVYRKNCKRGVSAVALFREYANLKSNTWQKMPALMLAKCAESLALRKAFPSDLSGLYTTDEMNNIEENNIVETTVIDVPKENYDINKDVYNGCEYSPFPKYSHIRFDEMEKGLLMWHINESQMQNTHPDHYAAAVKVLKEKKKDSERKCMCFGENHPYCDGDNRPVCRGHCREWNPNLPSLRGRGNSRRDYGPGECPPVSQEEVWRRPLFRCYRHDDRYKEICDGPRYLHRHRNAHCGRSEAGHADGRRSGYGLR